MAERWLRRTGNARTGFRYFDGGRPVRDARTISRIERLRVPPAWREVHIAPDARRTIQAWGFDARGRKQYRYHASAVASRELRKYHRVRQLAKTLPVVRRDLRQQSRRPSLDGDTTCAIALRLVSESLFRPGAERYQRDNGSYGLTTLRKRHLRMDERRAVFTYAGKSGRRQRQYIVDRELMRLLEVLRRAPGDRLFRYREDGRWCDLDAATLIRFVRRRFGPFAVKDFRTWGGTLRAATVLAELGVPRSPSEARRNVVLAMRIVSAELGNTPAVCRASYVHPIVIARYLDAGETIRLRRSRRITRSARSFAHSPEERALIAFLDRHFPERRRHARSPGDPGPVAEAA